MKIMQISIPPKSTAPKRLNTRMRIAAVQPSSTEAKNVNDLITSIKH